MNRLARIDFPEYPYHVFSRGQRKNPIFFSYHDMDFFINLLKKALRKFDFDLVGYDLMRNHYHLIPIRHKDSLGKIFHWINTNYAIYLNGTYGLVGHVFQGRFHSKIILDEKYLIIVLNYIQQNQLRAGIIKEGEIYRYSSENYYKNGVPDPLITRPLKTFFESEIDYDILNKQSYIGKEEDLEKNDIIKFQIENYFMIKKDDKKIDKIINKFLYKYNITFEYLLTRNHHPRRIMLRNQLYDQLYYKYNFSTLEIGKKFHRSYQSVHKIIKKKVEIVERRP